MWGRSLKRQFTIFSRSQSLAHILIRTHEFNRASTKRQYNLPAIFQYLFNFNELFQKRLCQGTYGFSFKLQGKCNILLVLLQRAGSTNLAYETKIVDIRETKELLLDNLRASSPARSDCGAKKEGKLATTSLEFEYLHRKSRCEILIGGDDISNDVITIGTCF